MESIDGNLIDAVWTDKPIRKFNSIISLPIRFAGQTIAKKLEIIRDELESKKCDSLIVTALDEVACNLLNLSISIFSILTITIFNLKGC